MLAKAPFCASTRAVCGVGAWSEYVCYAGDLLLREFAHRVPCIRFLALVGRGQAEESHVKSITTHDIQSAYPPEISEIRVLPSARRLVTRVLSALLV